ncbi:MAG TPA: type II toxin-antitoxin system death-on-curing family toxin [Rhodanobacteraceae bacterium]|jgi:death-on-curing protein|nr:type II toxin-antitoxin system death-on-curing family toxin [Rhodanobacteraceae bacterium]
MFVWIDRALAIAIHDRQLSEHGGSAGVRDEHLLDSALARPQQVFAYADPEPDLADLAAALAYGLARNHPFIDGNKRTALVACETFIELNDGKLEAEDADLFPIVLALAEGRLSALEFAAWLRGHLRSTGVHEPVTPYVVPKRAPTRKPSRRKSG